MKEGDSGKCYSQRRVKGDKRGGPLGGLAWPAQCPHFFLHIRPLPALAMSPAIVYLSPHQNLICVDHHDVCLYLQLGFVSQVREGGKSWEVVRGHRVFCEGVIENKQDFRRIVKDTGLQKAWCRPRQCDQKKAGEGAGKTLYGQSCTPPSVPNHWTAGREGGREDQASATLPLGTHQPTEIDQHD